MTDPPYTEGTLTEVLEVRPFTEEEMGLPIYPDTSRPGIRYITNSITQETEVHCSFQTRDDCHKVERFYSGKLHSKYQEDVGEGGNGSRYGDVAGLNSRGETTLVHCFTNRPSDPTGVVVKRHIRNTGR